MTQEKKTSPKNGHVHLGKRQRTQKSSFWIFLFFAILVGLIYWPLLIIGFIGLVPSLAMYCIDQDVKKYGFITVLIPNLIAVGFVVAHYAIIFKGGYHPGTVIQYLSKPNPWMGMYIPSCVAIFLQTQMTDLIKQSLVSKAQADIAQAKKEQEKLVDTWGSAVSGELPRQS